MELCPNGFGTIGQLVLEPVTESKVGSWNIFNPSFQRADVVCPEPCRANRIPFTVDGLNRFGCKSKSLNGLRGDNELEILDILLSKDDLEFDSDTDSRSGFFQGSPPVRTSNPIIRDVEFVKQGSKAMGSSPLVSTPGGKMASPMVERVPCGSSYGGKPKVRIEGFKSGNSESGCVVSARA